LLDFKAWHVCLGECVNGSIISCNQCFTCEIGRGGHGLRLLNTQVEVNHVDVDANHGRRGYHLGIP
jgi:hypothetical protein